MIACYNLDSRKNERIYLSGYPVIVNLAEKLWSMAKG